MASSCAVGEPVAEGNCGDHEVTIPDIPGDIPDINLPTIGIVTEESVTGQGVFDIYMRAGMNQLETQYKAGRIKGADYAAAYTAMTELMMTQANKFVIDKFTAEIGAVQAQIAVAMYELQFLGAGYDAALKKAQAEKVFHESALICQQKAELKLNGQSKRSLETAQEKVACTQIDLYTQQAASFAKKSSNDTFNTISNMWSVFVSEVNEDPTNTPAQMAAGNMDITIGSAKGKVGLA